MKNLVSLLKPFYNPFALLLILVGSLLFMARVKFAPDGWFDLPELATLIELVGGLFILMGFQIIASMLFWPAVLTDKLLSATEAGNVAAAVVLAGLKVFNGLCVIGFAIWLALTFNGAHL